MTTEARRQWWSVQSGFPTPGREVAVITESGDERRLIFESGLWWLPDRSMYVYFTPTMWRDLAPGEKPVDMSLKYMMECGDLTTLVAKDGQPVCLFHARSADGALVERAEVVKHIVVQREHIDPTSIDLTGRKARCTSCGTFHNSDGTKDDGTRVWRGAVPFLIINPDHDGINLFDSMYDGCRGWD